jgi:Mrp family chromosome partitioning ATPase
MNENGETVEPMDERNTLEKGTPEASQQPLREDLLQALRQVKDPELDRDLVTLGMIQNLTVKDHLVSLELALTTSHCPLQGQIEGDVRKALAGIPGIHEVSIQVREMSEEEKKRYVKGEEEGRALPFNRVRHVLAVMSGKGGVGKSMVTSLLATALKKAGNRVGVLDADITGPSIPRFFGIQANPGSCTYGILPPESRLGIKIISMNLFLEEEGQAVIWRGPLIAGAIRQFWGDVLWGLLDYLLVDLPPGTSDAPLTVLQSLPVQGVILVTSPQELAGMVVEKAAHLAEALKVPLLGLIENMAFLHCPQCGARIEPFGPSHAEKLARRLDVPLLGRLPIEAEIATCGDRGEIESCSLTGFAEIVQSLRSLLGEKKDPPPPPRPH